MLSAARQYEAAHGAWKQWERRLGAFNLVKRPKDAWESPEHRKAGAAAVQKALGCEKAAVAEVNKALQAITDRVGS